METADSITAKKLSGRKKKKLYNQIKTQMEFYFSDSNLAKDKFLKQLVEQHSEGYVDLEVFKTFNKIKILTEDTDVISEAVSKSHILKVDKERKRICRLAPLGPPKDFDACTLYVEKLPSYADHKWIKDVFEHFGVIDYINIPRFKISHKIKGFAFIEFNEPESVKKACKYYQHSNERDTIESDAEIKVSKEGMNGTSNVEKKKAKKRKASLDSENLNVEIADNDLSSYNPADNLSESENSRLVDLNKTHTELESASRKRRKSDDDDEKPPKKLKESENLHNSEQMEFVDNAEEEAKNRRKRKHKKRHNSERPVLRVMSKYEWKSYRNKYLALQRTTMSHIKKYIMLETQEWKEQEMVAKSENLSFSPKKGIQFQSGVILKATLADLIQDSTGIKDQVKATAVVAYIDASMGHSEMFIRCHTHEEAEMILQEKKLNHLGTIELLKGSEEEAYWKKIEDDRKAKFSVPLKNKKRGRDKIIAKAAKLEEQKNKHIYFDE